MENQEYQSMLTRDISENIYLLSAYDQNNNNNNNNNQTEMINIYNHQYYAKTNLDNCLAIDCNLAQTNLSPVSLSSSSSTTSTSSTSDIKSDSIDSTVVAVTCNKANKVVHKTKPLINKHLLMSSACNSPCASSSSECLSSDEGYVGSYDSYKHHHQLNQFFLLQYLLNNTFLLQQQQQQQQQQNKPQEVEEEEVEIKIPELFSVKQETEENKFSINQNEIELYENDYEWLTKMIFIDHENSSLSASPPGSGICDVSDCSFRLHSSDELKQLTCQLEMQKYEQNLQDEIEMCSRQTWRQIVEKRHKLQTAQREFNEEDTIDLNAYLNEIEMNLDYLQSEQIYNSNSISLDLDQSMLKFSTNRMAFNLRMYHEYVCQEMEKKTVKKSKNFTDIFANLHVDAIPEFVPPENEYFVDENLNDYLNENEYTMIEAAQDLEDTDESLNNLNSNLNLFETTITATGNELEMELANGDEAAVYYDYYEDYEDYDDQMLIDSLTEEEALALLRSESEMYALQMSQASKYGLLKKNKSKKKQKSRFNSGSNADDFCSKSNVDIFENVFNYEETAESVDGDVNEYDYFADANFEANFSDSHSTISQSLRNSLLKLRSSRRHLANLLELHTQSGSTTASSATSSLTTTSNMSLYKQHLLNQQHQMSRKPCVYMLNEGRCMRADCRFVHDLKTIICKYWLEGECLKGENCEFLHDYIDMTEQTIVKSSKSSFGSSFGKSKKCSAEAKLKKDFKLDTEEFPALGAVGDSNKNKQTTHGKASASVLLANVVKSSSNVKENKKAAKNEKSQSAKKAQKSAKSSSSTTPVISISIKSIAKKAAAANSCGSSMTSSSSSTASSRANSKIRQTNKK